MLETYLAVVAARSTILLLAGWLLFGCSRRQSPAMRHRICAAALAGSAVVPLLAFWSPRWSYAVNIPAAPGADPHHWPAIVAMIWALGAGILVLRAAGGWWILRRACQSSIPFLEGEGAPVRIGKVSTPLTCGVLKPLILLPEGARNWGATRLRVVLLHEAAHVQRHDCLAKHVAQVSRALLWWHPLAWMLSDWADQERERACDEAVLSAGVAPEDYAEALLETAREGAKPLLLGCAMGNSALLRSRLEHLFTTCPDVRRGKRRTALAIPLLLALMTGVSCAAKRTPQAQIPAGVNVVSVSNSRGAGARMHK